MCEYKVQMLVPTPQIEVLSVFEACNSSADIILVNFRTLKLRFQLIGENIGKTPSIRADV
jgi:hypothetical protein